MKHPKIALLALFAVFSLFAILRFTSEKRTTSKNLRSDDKNQSIRPEESSRDTERLQVAGLDISISYPDHTSERLKKQIHEDIVLIFQHMKRHSFVEISGEMTMEQNGRSLELQRFLNFEGPGAYRPDELDGKFGGIARINGEESLIMPSQLVDAYRSALRLKEKHSEKYEKLEKFIMTVNQATREQPVDLSPNQLLWTGESSIPEPNQIPDAVKNFSAVSLRQPSLLDYFEPTDQQNKNLPNLATKTLILESGTDIPGSEQVLVFQGGRWKFWYGRLGT
jgi:hypothetical protein